MIHCWLLIMNNHVDGSINYTVSSYHVETVEGRNIATFLNNPLPPNSMLILFLTRALSKATIILEDWYFLAQRRVSTLNWGEGGKHKFYFYDKHCILVAIFVPSPVPHKSVRWIIYCFLLQVILRDPILSVLWQSVRFGSVLFCPCFCFCSGLFCRVPSWCSASASISVLHLLFLFSVQFSALCSVLFSVLLCPGLLPFLFLFLFLLLFLFLFCSVLSCPVLFCSVLFCSVLLWSLIFCSILFQKTWFRECHCKDLYIIATVQGWFW